MIQRTLSHCGLYIIFSLSFSDVLLDVVPFFGPSDSLICTRYQSLICTRYQSMYITRERDYVLEYGQTMYLYGQMFSTILDSYNWDPVVCSCPAADKEQCGCDWGCCSDGTGSTTPVLRKDAKAPEGWDPVCAFYIKHTWGWGPKCMPGTGCADASAQRVTCQAARRDMVKAHRLMLIGRVLHPKGDTRKVTPER